MPLYARLYALCLTSSARGLEVKIVLNLIERLADRTVGLVVPKIKAEATHIVGHCQYIYCYCSGYRYYSKHCCKLEGGAISCGPCYYRGNYCI